MVFPQLTRYRKWIETKGIAVRLGLVIATIVLFVIGGTVAGGAPDSGVGYLISVVLILAFLFFILYTLYGVVRSFVPG